MLDIEAFGSEGISRLANGLRGNTSLKQLWVKQLWVNSPLMHMGIEGSNSLGTMLGNMALKSLVVDDKTFDQVVFAQHLPCIHGLRTLTLGRYMQDFAMDEDANAFVAGSLRMHHWSAFS